MTDKFTNERRSFEYLADCTIVLAFLVTHAENIGLPESEFVRAIDVGILFDYVRGSQTLTHPQFQRLRCRAGSADEFFDRLSARIPDFLDEQNVITANDAAKMVGHRFAIKLFAAEYLDVERSDADRFARR